MIQTASPTYLDFTREAAAWLDPEPLPDSGSLASLHADPLLAALLYRRGIRDAATARDFLDTRPRPTPPTSIVPNLTAAVDRIGVAIDNKERIGIFGDYDVDGITSTALLIFALGTAGNRDLLLPVLPERQEGYGLNRAGIDRIRDFGASLLICVDCASTDHEHVAYARSLGLDVVILDHHQMSDDGPDGAIVASPQLTDDPAVRILTAVGLTWLAVCGLARTGHDVTPDGETEKDYLDLVALGTVADVAPLHGLNRVLVREGLEVLRRTRRPGIASLISQAKLSQKGLQAEQIAFQLAPRINAAGRLATPKAALDLLISTDVREAFHLAGELNTWNMTRRSKQQTAVENAIARILELPDWTSRGFVTAVSPAWEPGLVGVVAGRLSESLRRPVIAFREENGVLVGSARSVKGFDIAAALRSATHLLERHGGHEQAAGLMIRRENLEQFTDHMLEAVAACGTSIPVARTIALDADLDDEHLTINTVRAIDQLQPFGEANRQPVLRVREAHVEKYTTLSDGKHLKIFARRGNRRFEAIQWNAGWRSRELVTTRTIDLAGKLEINEFNGSSRLQMNLEDFRPS